MAMPPAEQQPTHTRLPGQEGHQPLAMVGASTPCSAPASWAAPAALSQHRHLFSAELQVTAGHVIVGKLVLIMDCALYLACAELHCASEHT